MRADETTTPQVLTGFVNGTALQRHLTSLRDVSGNWLREQRTLDCAGVTGFTCDAIVILADVAQRLRRAGGELKLVNISSEVLTAMRRLLLLEILERELTKGLGDGVKNIANALAESTRRYQYFWNN